MSVNLVTLGMFYSLAVFAYVPGANPILAIVLAAVAVTFLAVAYSGLIAAMPRAGGDYIWQSRVLDGIPGILTGAVVGGVAGYLVGQAVGLDQTLALVSAASAGSSSAASIGYLNGGIGFVLAATGWWFILAMWAPIYGAILNIEFFQPLAALVKSADGLAFFASEQRHPVRVDRDDHPDVRRSSRSAWPAMRGSRSGACISVSSASASCSC